ncbi:MAG: LuxR family maltose regulon positive regulatory protein [Acidimicrobiales bacterium]
MLGDGVELDELVNDLDVDRLDAVADTIMANIERRSHPLVVVLDDLHEISDGDTMEVLGRIVSHLPANLRVVITSRLDPPLPIGRLRSQGDLVEVRAQNLAFTVDEAGAVFVGLDLHTVGGIVEHTEGWATALRLLAVSMSGSTEASQALGAVSVHGGDVAEFLAAEALGSLRPDLQRFLVVTSIVDELGPDLADLLTGNPGSLATLRELARSQVFTDLVDPATNTYRYHRLFRDFLRLRAQELEPALLADLHQSAADWYVVREEPTSAIEHAMEAGNDALATMKQHFSAYGQSGRMATANIWLETYGLDRCFRDPELRLIAAWVLLNIRRYDDVERWLELPEGEAATAVYLTQLHSIRSHLARHRGLLDLSLQETTKALEFVPADREDHLDYSFVHAACSMAQTLPGEPDLETAMAAVSNARIGHNVSSMMTGFSGMAAWALGTEGGHDEAEAYADQALALVTSPTLERFHQPVTALLVKSDVAMNRGHIGDAVEFAERAERIAVAAIEPLHTIRARCQLAVVSHAQGHPDVARRWLREAEAILADCDAPELGELIRKTSNDTRFARGDAGLPVELSERELAVLHLLPHGLSRKELGAQLFVSENTAKTHLTSLRHKLGVNGRGDEIGGTGRRTRPARSARRVIVGLGRCVNYGATSCWPPDRYHCSVRSESNRMQPGRAADRNPHRSQPETDSCLLRGSVDR